MLSHEEALMYHNVDDLDILVFCCLNDRAIEQMPRSCARLSGETGLLFNDKTILQALWQEKDTSVDTFASTSLLTEEKYQETYQNIKVNSMKDEGHLVIQLRSKWFVSLPLAQCFTLSDHLVAGIQLAAHAKRTQADHFHTTVWSSEPGISGFSVSDLNDTLPSCCGNSDTLSSLLSPWGIHDKQQAAYTKDKAEEGQILPSCESFAIKNELLSGLSDSSWSTVHSKYATNTQ